MDREAITGAYERALEDFFADNPPTVSGLIERLGGGVNGKRQLTDMLGGNPETQRRNINRWLSYERGERGGSSRKPSEKTLGKIEQLMLKTVKGFHFVADGTFADYDGSHLRHRNATPVAGHPTAKEITSFLEHMQAGDTVRAWDDLLGMYGVSANTLIPVPGEVEVEITLE